ncbi:hypothetical protein GYMLUDRAFT_249993 [Collybiopsis luxurians FD-317 M1]|uniref:N-acetyltransferase domain-containing protein n=1 Tax=Collybiopsis luxurians FD-317 M1 TaxID=944289 RepID=A0A0D0BGX2_9AGAR|nr:hypothetical protein GYMLUDRAFT_249993 [Collybiopsis luxurians FD-317 M1]
MSNINVLRVVTLSDAEMKALSLLCFQALRDDPGSAALLDGNLSLGEGYFELMIRATLLEGYLLAVKNDAGEIVSVGAWFAPGTALFATEAQRALGLQRFFSKLSPQGRDWYKTTYPNIIKSTLEGLFSEHEGSHRWWCSLLCTDNRAQNKGYGTAIVNYVCDLAKKNDELIALACTTTENVAKYTAMGMRERGKTTVPHPHTPSFDIHVMTREN